MQGKFHQHILIIMFLALIPTLSFAQGSVKEAEELDFAQGLLSRGMYDMAILQYQKFITTYPQSPSLQDAYLSLGEGYFLSQEYQKAVDAFHQFKQLFPNSDKIPVSVLRLGQIDIEQKKFDDAVTELSSVDIQKLSGKMLQYFDYYLGQAYMAKSDPVSALGYFQKATQVTGDNNSAAEAFEEIGRIETQNSHYPQALDAYTKGMALTDDKELKAELNYRAAETQFITGKYDEAITAFHQFITQYPDSNLVLSALANLLLAYFNSNQYDLLIKEYQQDAGLIKDDNTCLAVHNAAVLAYIELKEFDQANALLDRMLGFSALKTQDKARIFIKKADILIRQKKFSDAMALLDAYAAQDLDDADESGFLKAQGYFGLADYDHAFSSFENVYVNFPHSRFANAALLGQAHCRQKTGRYKESEALFLKFNALGDQGNLKSEGLYDAVMMAQKAGDVKGVISTAQEYLKDFPAGEQYSQVLLILANNYGKNGQADEAVKLLQGYLSSPQAAQRPNAAHFLLAYHLQLEGKGDEALEAYKLVDQTKEEGKFYFAALKNMAIIYLTQKNFEQARVYFDNLISASADNNLGIKTYIWVCNEYLKLQKYDDVQRIAALAEKKFSGQDLREITYFEAEALRGAGKCEEAIKDYDGLTASAQKDVYSGSAHIGHGLCLAQDKKWDEAKSEFQKALDENPDEYTVTAHARYEIANANSAQGNLEEALKFYLLVATIYDNDHYCSESLLHAAQISEKLNRQPDALKLYHEIVDKFPGSPAAKNAKDRIGLLK